MQQTVFQTLTITHNRLSSYKNTLSLINYWNIGFNDIIQKNIHIIKTKIRLNIFPTKFSAAHMYQKIAYTAIHINY